MSSQAVMVLFEEGGYVMKKLDLYLIKPTQYDDEGYVVRHWRGVLPSNTLACLAGLTEEVVAKKRLGESVLWLQTRHRSEAEQRVIEELCKIRRQLSSSNSTCSATILAAER